MKRWCVFLLCVLLSGTLWLLRMLSMEYAQLVSVTAVPESNLEGRAAVASSPVTISARCTATGYSLLSILSRKKNTEFHIASEDLVYLSGDMFSISSEKLSGYVEDIFGKGVSLESFLEDSYVFRFDDESNKRVPVLVNKLITYTPQYMALSDMEVEPDSVTVYGDPSVLRNVHGIQTKQVMMSDVRTSQHGLVKLLPPDGVRLSESEVTYSLDVTRFVEIPVSVSVGTVNVPMGVNFLVFPNVAEVTCRCVFPTGNCIPEDIAISVDYEDFTRSISGRCIPHIDNIPEGVISVSISPRVFDCIEQ